MAQTAEHNSKTFAEVIKSTGKKVKRLSLTDKPENGMVFTKNENGVCDLSAEDKQKAENISKDNQLLADIKKAITTATLTANDANKRPDPANILERIRYESAFLDAINLKSIDNWNKDNYRITPGATVWNDGATQTTAEVTNYKNDTARITVRIPITLDAIQKLPGYGTAGNRPFEEGFDPMNSPVLDGLIQDILLETPKNLEALFLEGDTTGSGLLSVIDGLIEQAKDSGVVYDHSGGTVGDSNAAFGGADLITLLNNSAVVTPELATQVGQGNVITVLPPAVYGGIAVGMTGTGNNVADRSIMNRDNPFMIGGSRVLYGGAMATTNHGLIVPTRNVDAIIDNDFIIHVVDSVDDSTGAIQYEYVVNAFVGVKLLEPQHAVKLVDIGAATTF